MSVVRLLVLVLILLTGRRGQAQTPSEADGSLPPPPSPEADAAQPSAPDAAQPSAAPVTALAALPDPSPGASPDPSPGALPDTSPRALPDTSPGAPPATHRHAHGPTSSSVSLATPAASSPLPSPTPPPGYALPFQLRSVSPRNGVRIDTIVAPYRYNDMNALETVVYLSAQVRLQQHFFLQARWGVADNRVGTGDRNRTGFVNPTIGITMAFPIGPIFRFAAMTSFGLPLATGGGEGDADGAFLQRQGMLARSSMENNHFTPNDLGFPTGLSLAVVHRGFTAQLDGTIIPAGRVKGSGRQEDGARVNSTFGLFAGYFIIPEISLGMELRYQYFLLPPSFVDVDPSARANLTAGAGGRIEIELSDSTRMRPGICLSTGLAGYVQQQSFRMVQFDVPISF